ncbi:DNA repair protein RecN [Arachnia propionica]|uniref:DNA repair protein RecN n=1 Tax=Arachnia propionica TaxID=1750 RepID=A0A3P1T693_9ACTN|nr:DNA repair protein RecN [Arachnia propionica]MDO5083418.1 DNA repair protein RecN [Arachnia propionica]RRD04860.1 DNA repair protein RecN [Arachnia propionica]
MLTELRLTSLGVVADACLNLGPGLNALTGETGAGKTMLVAGLGLLLGARADASLVRSGEGRAVVQGRWDVGEGTRTLVEELGGSLDDGVELVSVRQVTAQGRSRAVIGGAAVPVSAAASLLGELATIHGQSEQVRLSSPERQREILDHYARPEALQRYRENYAEHRRLVEELTRLETEALERAREVDMLRHGLDEIATVGPRPGEDEDLAAEALRLADADHLKLLASQVQTALSGSEEDFELPSAVGLVGVARKTLRTLADQDPAAQDLANRLDDLGYVIDDLAQDIASYTADLVSDPVRLAAVADRRGELSQLTRKYGTTIDEVLAWAEESRDRLAELEGADERIDELREQVAELDRALTADAASITADRVAASKRLAKAAHAELQALALKHARLEFAVTAAPRGPHGADRVELMFTANPGSTPGPLGKVASGGELSRVRLALEVVLAGGTPGHTFVFDEVDAGVGGAVGLEIGRRLKRLARTSQVIVVTHLAQVAAFADQHFVIAKSSRGQVTTSDVTPLGEEDRAAELARMMSGTVDSSAAIEHATELLELASQG